MLSRPGGVEPEVRASLFKSLGHAGVDGFRVCAYKGERAKDAEHARDAGTETKERSLGVGVRELGTNPCPEGDDVGGVCGRSVKLGELSDCNLAWVVEAHAAIKVRAPRMSRGQVVCRSGRRGQGRLDDRDGLLVLFSVIFVERLLRSEDLGLGDVFSVDGHHEDWALVLETVLILRWGLEHGMDVTNRVSDDTFEELLLPRSRVLRTRDKPPETARALPPASRIAFAASLRRYQGTSRLRLRGGRI